ncbi:MAG: hypothetical protein EPO07_20625 [Verrucomicrobia bacterium]|nr:MAG: hypothetical protein EPO07_20625 [Verrucomicrobiota bacterium]
MKSTSRNSQRGSALVITVITGALTGFVLCSYLGLTTSRNRASMRATAWNTAIPVLEAGIEETLTHLHEDADRLTANSWTKDVVNGQTVYTKDRKKSPWPDGSYYSVTISNITGTSPAIYSVGHVKSPLEKHEYINRLVRVSLTNPPSLFSRAIAANGPVRLSGGAVVDGFDSSLGAYDPVTNRLANGGIATNSKQPKAIDVGSAHLYGTAVTGPGGTVAVNGGAVGDLNWNSTQVGVEPGWSDDNMNVSFQPNTEPTGPMTIPTTTAVGVSNITYLTSGNYQASTFVSNDKTRPMIVIGDATLWVTGDFVVSGSGYVYIAPGASLKLYVAGTGSISGGGIVNGGGSPASLAYFGLPTSKTLTYNGTANFIGTINAPQADFAISGGASVFGAVIANSFTSSGGSGVHYDQAARGKAILLVTGWRELSL